MKCKVFRGDSGEAAADYNEWAKDRVLTKDVIIHTHVVPCMHEEQCFYATYIIVFYDEKMHPSW